VLVAAAGSVLVAAGTALVAAGTELVAASCPVCAGACCVSAVVPAVTANAVSLEVGAGAGSLLLVTLAELLEALWPEWLVFELAADATRVAGALSVVGVLATWRSARSDLFDLAGLDSWLADVPASPAETRLVVGATAGGAAGGTLGGVAA
jgi:hypothetical protein